MHTRARQLAGAIVITAGALLAMIPNQGWADVPDSIHYAGVLRTSDGELVPDGGYTVAFTIYGLAVGGVPLWSETQYVTTSSGLFNTLLGSVTPLPPTLFSASNRFLGITVAPDPEMTPRTPIVSVPYAFRIATVDGATGGAIGGNTSIAGDLTLSGGNIHLNASTATDGNILKGGVPFIHNYGTSNTFVGIDAGNLTTTGTGRNTAIGGGALDSITSGHFNTAVGNEALVSNTTGYSNAGVGGQALAGNISGYYNTSIGFEALEYNTTGGNNTAIGWRALWNNTTGLDNTAIGTYALSNDTTGQRITAIGYNANTSKGYLWNATAIGYGATVSNSSSMVFGNESVTKWGFGVNAASGHALEVGTTASNGNGAYLTTGGAWTNACDRNVKEGITPVDAHLVLEKVSGLPIYLWNYKDEDPTHKHIGPMAQDFFDHLGLGDDNRHISTIDPAGVALAAIQALYAQQKADNERLREEIAELRKMISTHAIDQK